MASPRRRSSRGSVPRNGDADLRRVGKTGRTDNNEDRYFSRAVSKALEVLEILQRSSDPLALHELTAKVHLTKSSLFRILHTLEGAGYVEKTGAGHYVIPVERRSLVPTNLLTRLLRIGRPHLTELTREFRESTAIGVMFDNHIEVVAVVESPQIVRMGNTPGRILEPHASSIGKSIAAFQTEERRERLLRSYGVPRVTPHTITDETTLREEFRRVREQGYAIDNEETALDGQCFGAPIFTPNGEVLAALSMSVPATRVGSAERREQLIAAVMRTARAISDEWS